VCVCFCVLLFLIAPFMLSYLVYFYGQMLVHLCLSVLLSLMSHIVFICMIIFELINDDDDDDDDEMPWLQRWFICPQPVTHPNLIVCYYYCIANVAV